MKVRLLLASVDAPCAVGRGAAVAKLPPVHDDVRGVLVPHGLNLVDVLLIILVAAFGVHQREAQVWLPIRIDVRVIDLLGVDHAEGGIDAAVLSEYAASTANSRAGASASTTKLACPAARGTRVLNKPPLATIDGPINSLPLLRSLLVDIVMVEICWAVAGTE